MRRHIAIVPRVILAAQPLPLTVLDDSDLCTPETQNMRPRELLCTSGHAIAY